MHAADDGLDVFNIPNKAAHNPVLQVVVPRELLQAGKHVLTTADNDWKRAGSYLMCCFGPPVRVHYDGHFSQRLDNVTFVKGPPAVATLVSPTNASRALLRTSQTNCQMPTPMASRIHFWQRSVQREQRGIFLVQLHHPGPKR